DASRPASSAVTLAHTSSFLVPPVAERNADPAAALPNPRAALPGAPRKNSPTQFSTDSRNSDGSAARSAFFLASSRPRAVSLSTTSEASLKTLPRNPSTDSRNSRAGSSAPPAPARRRSSSPSSGTALNRGPAATGSSSRSSAEAALAGSAVAPSAAALAGSAADSPPSAEATLPGPAVALSVAAVSVAGVPSAAGGSLVAS